ncbi:3'-N-debenzoyl-2'-deoxytaxol N-benzoyltransferase [Hordeum vulgare]|nr:3'-N-debenzoyl-2'-deoxytaxol N-benzoyltransferase [Hordeum vulgare]
MLSPSLIEFLRFCETTRARNISLSREVVLLENHVTDLRARYPGKFCRHTDPLLLVQVTEFTCDRFAVVAMWNHVLTDREDMAQFLGDARELLRGASLVLFVMLFRVDDDLLPHLPPSMVAAQKLGEGQIHVQHELHAP